MKKFLFLLCCFVVTLSGWSQNGREYIRQQIGYHNECKNVAITRTNGDAMLYGTNGWAAQGCPIGFTDALHKLNDNGDLIDDIQLTEYGRWLILYGNNGILWSDIPYSLENKLREYNSNGEIITSVTFNDAGNWIVISQRYVSASDGWIREWLKDGTDKFGQLWAACITDDAMVAVYAQGYKFYGNVPQSLKDALDETSKDIYRIKIAGSHWFIADKYGWYRYKM